MFHSWSQWSKDSFFGPVPNRTLNPRSLPLRTHFCDVMLFYSSQCGLCRSVHLGQGLKDSCLLWYLKELFILNKVFELMIQWITHQDRQLLPPTVSFSVIFIYIVYDRQVSQVPSTKTHSEKYCLIYLYRKNPPKYIDFFFGLPTFFIKHSHRFRQTWELINDDSVRYIGRNSTLQVTRRGGAAKESAAL